jgi:EAL and modified HD-GYP domain-containing signal transduction protein
VAAAPSQALQSAASAFGLRRPLVGQGGGVAGFELQLPPSAERRIAARADAAAAAAHHVALMSAAKPLTDAGRTALLRLPAALLSRPAVCAAAPGGAMLLVEDLAGLPAEVAVALRGRGVRMGLTDRPPAREPAVDFVVLQAAAGGLDTLLLSAQRWREVWPRLTVVALGLAHLDQVEQVLLRGVSLAGGHLDRPGVAPPRRELGATAHRVCELLNHLALDRDTAVIAQAVRGDVALTYRLLRYVNSPAIGLARALETVDQAVLVLGRAELYRWLSVQLMSAADARQATPALQETALARGRLLEAVAQARSDADPGAHFTLGLLSMIEPLLQVPVAAAIEPLRLGGAAQEALLRRQGPWAERLELVEAIDAGDAQRVEELAAALGVGETLAELADQAWGWAAAVAESAGPQRAAAGAGA